MRELLSTQLVYRGLWRNCPAGQCVCASGWVESGWCLFELVVLCTVCCVWTSFVLRLCCVVQLHMSRLRHPWCENHPACPHPPCPRLYFLSGWRKPCYCEWKLHLLGQVCVLQRLKCCLRSKLGRYAFERFCGSSPPSTHAACQTFSQHHGRMRPCERAV